MPAPQRMTPSEALVETLAANGVTEVFGIVGSAYMDALDIFPAAGIRFIPVAHEQGAAHMADGYARASGRHGVCIAQNGPGVTNFVTAIAAAYWAHSPVVFITPETGSLTMGLGGFQETEQLPIFSKITKYQGHVNNPKRMAEIAGALLRSRNARDGADAAQHPARLLLRRHPGGDRAADAHRPRRRRRRSRSTRRRRCLRGAKFPVILAGGGVIMSGGTAEAVQLAELLHAPVCQQLPAQRFVPRLASAVVRPARLPGLEGGDEADRRRPTWCSRSARGSARSARCRSTAWTTGRRTRRSSRSTPMRECSGW